MDEQVTGKPVLLQRIDYDREGRLVLILNQPVMKEWIRAFWGISDTTFFPGKEPRNFSFEGNRAYIHYDNEGQQLIDYFKDYLTRANTLYQQRREDTRLKAEAKEQHQRQQDLDWHEHRARIVDDLRP
jgi:predicted restriction endonuclease